MRDAKGDPTRLRTQYQDTEGNRLDRHFGKGGGFFANATNNLLEMYGGGFHRFARHIAQLTVSNVFYIGKAPRRAYFVMAATRLAMLIREIRRVSPDDTITIMAHSQGTLITLLAQAMLADEGERCADCVIMVASPYCVLPKHTPKSTDSLQTLIDIVGKITAEPHTVPPLSELTACDPGSAGRAGPRWKAQYGARDITNGANKKTYVFPERDNRGKVYLYFSPDDTSVGLKDVSGIGNLGVPDTLPDGTPVMRHLQSLRFYQRLWTKRKRDERPVLLGTEPGLIQLRAPGEPRYMGTGFAKPFVYAAVSVDEMRTNNGEALTPPYVPDMAGMEAAPGMDRPDAVSRDVALGNPKASFHWIFVRISDSRVQLDTERDQWNAGKDEDKQSRKFSQYEDIDDSYHPRRVKYIVKREETPFEIRERMKKDSDVLDENSYHSAILRSAQNQQRVTAMDIALGQAKALDDPDMREVLVAIANWRIDEKGFKQDVIKLPGWERLGAAAQSLVAACVKYYSRGVFPSEQEVSLKPPAVIKGVIKQGEAQ